eukprot:Hpha_TRINITY_DN16147_c2_g1::TRINITY_DN16147_c2_g1_i3::g.6142::m.6142
MFITREREMREISENEVQAPEAVLRTAAAPQGQHRAAVPWTGSRQRRRCADPCQQSEEDRRGRTPPRCSGSTPPRKLRSSSMTAPPRKDWGTEAWGTGSSSAPRGCSFSPPRSVTPRRPPRVSGSSSRAGGQTLGSSSQGLTATARSESTAAVGSGGVSSLRAGTVRRVWGKESGWVYPDDGGGRLALSPLGCAAVSEEIPPSGTRVLFTVEPDPRSGPAAVVDSLLPGGTPTVPPGEPTLTSWVVGRMASAQRPLPLVDGSASAITCTQPTDCGSDDGDESEESGWTTGTGIREGVWVRLSATGQAIVDASRDWAECPIDRDELCVVVGTDLRDGCTYPIVQGRRGARGIHPRLIEPAPAPPQPSYPVPAPLPVALPLHPAPGSLHPAPGPLYPAPGSLHAAPGPLHPASGPLHPAMPVPPVHAYPPFQVQPPPLAVPLRQPAQMPLRRAQGQARGRGAGAQPQTRSAARADGPWRPRTARGTRAGRAVQERRREYIRQQLTSGPEQEAVAAAAEPADDTSEA